MESFTEMTEAMEALVERTRTTRRYSKIWRSEKFDSFEEKRAAWSQLLALAPRLLGSVR
jgi:hypothetical protein